MKLNDIKPVTLTEGIVPITYLMTLLEVVKAKKITNTVQALLIAQLIEMLKYDKNQNILAVRELNDYIPTGNLVTTVKDLVAEEQVELAGWLFDFLKSGKLYNQDVNCYIDPDMEIHKWIRWVLRKNDE